MFEEFLDLPAHPLLIHMPIVLIPMSIAVSIVYVLLPRVRRYVEWSVVLLAVAAPLATLAARLSGDSFKQRLESRSALPGQLASDVAEHERLSLVLIWLVVALSVVIVLFVVASRWLARGRAGEHDGAESGDAGAMRLITGIAIVAVIGLSGATGYYLFETGDLGARMVWEGR